MINRVHPANDLVIIKVLVVSDSYASVIESENGASMLFLAKRINERRSG